MNDLAAKGERDLPVVDVVEQDLDPDGLADLEFSFGRDEDATLRDILLELLAKRLQRLESDLHGFFLQ